LPQQPQDRKIASQSCGFSMRHFPAFLDLHGRAALVLGTGEVGQRKAALLERAGAVVRLRDRFDAGALEGCAVAVGADAPEADLRALSHAAQARGIPVNIVDRPGLGPGSGLDRGRHHLRHVRLG